MNEPFSVEVEELNDTQRNLKISVGVNEVEQAMQSACDQIRQKARIKGFRKGKAPLGMVKKIYGSEIQSEAVQHLLEISYPQALDQCQLKIISRPMISDLNFSAGEPFTYIAKVEIMPDIDLKKYKDFKLEILDDKVSDEQVLQQLEQIQESQAQLTPVETPRPLEHGDFAIIDFAGTVDGKPFDGGTGDGMTIELGKGMTVPGFEDNLLGVTPGEEKEFDVVFPEGMAELSEKTVHFRVTVKEMKEKKLPELNDDLAKDLGDFSTLDDLRQNVRQNLQRAATDRSDQDCKEKIFSALRQSNPLEIPESLIQQEVDQMVHDAKHNLQTQGQTLPPGEDQIWEKLKLDYHDEAKNRVHTGLLLDAIAKVEKFEVLDEDLNRFLQQLSSRSQMPVEEIRKHYQKPEAIEHLKFRCLEEKTLEFLRQNAKIIKKIDNLVEPLSR